MRNNKHTGFGKEAMLVTRSPRYLAGTRANKPKYYTKKKNRGRPMWLTEKLLREWERQDRTGWLFTGLIITSGKTDRRICK